MGDYRLEVKGLCKHYSGIQVLDHVDLALRPGKVHVLLGACGAGKSVFVRCLMASEQADEGSVYLDERPLKMRSTHEILDSGIDFARQNPDIIPGRSIGENMFFGRFPEISAGPIRLVDQAVLNREANSWLKELNIPYAAWERAEKLDAAQRQLLEIARAMAIADQVLVLDSPAALLSDEETDFLFKGLNKLKENGCAILYTTESVEEAMRIGDDITVLYKGKTVGSWSEHDFDLNAIEEALKNGNAYAEKKELKTPTEERGGIIWSYGLFRECVQRYSAAFAIMVFILGVFLMKHSLISGAQFPGWAAALGCRLILAVGIAEMMITGVVDLSAGALIGLSACASAVLIEKPQVHPIFVFVLILLCSVLIGIINGVLIEKLKVSAALITLALGYMYYGAGSFLTGGSVIRIKEESLLKVGKASAAGIPLSVIAAIVILAAAAFWMQRTIHGRNCYAIGGCRKAAIASGIQVRKTVVTLFAMVSVLYGIAGFLMAAQSGRAEALFISGMEIEAILACLLGGISAAGGKGTVFHAVIGMIILELLKAACAALGIGDSIQTVVCGMLFAVVLYANHVKKA